MTDLHYPIGKFEWSGSNTDADRREYIEQTAEALGELRAGYTRRRNSSSVNPARLT
jgi:hypothetical protein